MLRSEVSEDNTLLVQLAKYLPQNEADIEIQAFQGTVPALCGCRERVDWSFACDQEDETQQLTNEHQDQQDGKIMQPQQQLRDAMRLYHSTS